MSLESIHTQKGYNEIIAFVNAELVNPTSGLHASIITDIINTIVVNDFWMYVEEVWSDDATYKGVIMITTDLKALYIENGTPKYANVNPVEVANLFEMLPEGGLSKFYSDTVNLYNNDTSALEAQMQIYKTEPYEQDVYFFYLREGINFEITGENRIYAQTVENQYLTNYNVKIDKTPYEVITMQAARNSYTKFQVQVTDKVFVELEYNSLGEILTVQDTPLSRTEVTRLVREGVVFANI